ncbi:universal stress protein [Streptomyces lincolnensis]|uniref:universal stress protein n=1 Tax=Streptomyces lincolnensis TaxID=1915 RepID=UPI001E28E026|nr:universal stress protein [Streptomyces lincolnensis]MCD7442279.1 universal stress protein [Streptomyces lincolnensis]
MELPVVVGVDGSESSLRAVDWAADEAALRGVPLRLVFASLWEHYEGSQLAEALGKQSERVRAQNIMDSVALRAHRRQADVKVSTHVEPEEPDYVLVRESRSASLLVTGNRGRTGLAEALLGSVSLTVAGHAHCPMVVVRGDHDDRTLPGTYDRIVLGVGEGPTAPVAVRFAVEEAQRRRVPVEALRAWRCPAHESTDHPLLTGEPARLHEQRAVEDLEAALKEVPADVDLRRRTVEGHPRTVLVEASHRAGLLVIGARRGQRHFGLQLGRVAHGVLHHSACPVAIVPERA